MNNIIVYSDGELELKVSVNDETIWLNQKQISELFEVSKQNTSLHINNIFKEDELNDISVVKDYLTTAKDGKKYKTKHYSLDMIISIGYRVNSKKAIKFRQWATSVLKSYITNGYSINEHKLSEQRMSLLENDVATIKSHIKDNTLDIKQGIFFNGQIFDAYVFVSDLIKSAKNSIVLIDNYIDESILTLFSKNQNINIVIHTKSIPKQLKLDIEKYNKQYNNLQVKITKRFHDRFIIIDDIEVYHIGASLKDLGSKVFAFTKIDIDKDKLI